MCLLLDSTISMSDHPATEFDDTEDSVMRRKALFLLVAFLSSSACRRSSDVYKIIEHKQSESGSSFHPWVKLVLLHDGKILNARCNNYKAAANTDEGVPCKLRVGDVIKCQAFVDRMSEDAGGYDLICGD